MLWAGSPHLLGSCLFRGFFYGAKNVKNLNDCIFLSLDMEYGDVPCAGVVTLIGKVHGNISPLLHLTLHA